MDKKGYITHTIHTQLLCASHLTNSPRQLQTTKKMLTESELKDISDRCDSATKGPWKSFIEGRDHESGSDFIQTPDGDIELIGGTKEDQDFIAQSRTDVPKLIEEIKRLKTNK